MEPTRLDDQLQMLAEGFVLGTLSPAESQGFAARLAAHEAHALAAFEEARQLMLALPFALPQETPPAQLKQRILSAISLEERKGTMVQEKERPASIRALPQRTFRQSFMRSLAWAAVFLLFAVGYGYWNQQKRIAALLQEIDGLQHQLAFHVQVQKVMQKSHRLVIALNATKPEQEATATALVDRELGRGYFFTDKLARLDADHDYQLWYIGKSGPVDAGVFRVDAEGYGAINIRNLPQDLAEISAFAVTIEPKGGSKAPTLDQMILLGKVG